MVVKQILGVYIFSMNYPRYLIVKYCDLFRISQKEFAEDKLGITESVMNRFLVGTDPCPLWFPEKIAEITAGNKEALQLYFGFIPERLKQFINKNAVEAHYSIMKAIDEYENYHHKD